MSLALTTQEAEEARVLIARLGVLLAVREAPVAPLSPGPPPALQPADFVSAAATLACDVAAIRAVYEVESNGHGFGPDGRPVILFEPHVFSRLTNHRFDATHGGVSYPKWGAKPYPKDQKARWDQLLYAARLDHDAAYRSASYGGPQIMGFNFGLCAFPSVDAFVAAMSRGEAEQLQAFVQFIVSTHLDDELRAHDWPVFAERYNGPAHAQHNYAGRLAAAHAKWSAA